LVVDDDKAVLNAHGAMLRQMGYDPRTTCDPLEALEWVNAEAFDVVITDLRMPGLSGVELAKKVRESHPGIRILLLTGFEGGLAEYSDLSFIDQIMRKPIRKADLLEAVFELSVDG
jgi:DNA-binding NtrC family response regulator